MLNRFYPVLPDVDWLVRLVPLGIKCVQLRVKDRPAKEVRRQIAASLELCAEHGCRLVVNDYWQEAIELGADFVHLGQEDLADADIKAIKRERIALGVSTHDPDELDIALKAEPDYIALGPIYETRLKTMRFAPQGLERLGEWKALIACPLVAIGGITVERAPEVLRAGADAIAVVTDLVMHPDPAERVREWIAVTGLAEQAAVQRPS